MITFLLDAVFEGRRGYKTCNYVWAHLRKLDLVVCWNNERGFVACLIEALYWIDLDIENVLF